MANGVPLLPSSSPFLGRLKDFVQSAEKIPAAPRCVSKTLKAVRLLLLPATTRSASLTSNLYVAAVAQISLLSNAHACASRARRLSCVWVCVTAGSDLVGFFFFLTGNKIKDV